MTEKVLGVNGSPRTRGNSDILMRYVLKGVASRGILSEEIRLRDYQFQSCLGCERCRKDKQCTGLQDGMQLIYPKVREARGVVLISPIHNYNITALMKAYIDRLYSFYNFNPKRPGLWSSELSKQERKAVIVIVGEQASYEDSGMDLALDVMRRPIKALGYKIIGELPVLGIFHKGGVKEYPQILEQAEALGRSLASLL